MALNIGINVLETDGSATPAIAGAATSTAGFCIPTARGIPNEPLFLTSFAEFTRRFGTAADGHVGAHLVEGFFKNGGSRAWVSRLVTSLDTDNAAATATLFQRQASNTRGLIEVFGGYRGVRDPGPWADGYWLEATPSFSSQVTAGADVSATGASLGSVAGLKVGDRIVVSHGVNRHVTDVATLDSVDRSLTWSDSIDTDLADFQQDDAVVATVSSTITVVAPDGEVLETFEDVSWGEGDERYIVDILNSTVSGSRQVTVVDTRTTNRVADDGPAFAITATLGGGTAGDVDTVDYLGSAEEQTGIRAFDPIDIQLLTIDTSETNAVSGALDYCQERDDCMFVGSVPQGSVAAGQAVEYGAGLQGAKVYGALYGPWIQIVDPQSVAADPTVFIPPSGHVMGVYARTEANRGIAKAPAGDQARVFGAVGIESKLSDAQHTDLVERGSVNGIRFIPGAGIVVDSSRTLSTDTRWRYVNVRLLFNYVKSSLRVGLRWVRQEPNRDTLWTSVHHGSVRPFLLGLWRQGAFGTGTPDEVFTIVCDETNNPPDQVDLGFFNVEVTFYPSKPAEKIVIKVGQQPSGATTAES